MFTTRSVQILLPVFLVLICGSPVAAADTVVVADHEIVGLPSPANRGLRLLQVKIKVDYTLTSKPKAVVKFLVDRDAPMSFVTVDHKNVSTTKKKMDLDLVVRLENFARKELRGIVLLEDPDAAPGSKPLAMIGISLDVQKFQSGG